MKNGRITTSSSAFLYLPARNAITYASGNEITSEIRVESAAYSKDLRIWSW